MEEIIGEKRGEIKEYERKEEKKQVNKSENPSGRTPWGGKGRRVKEREGRNGIKNVIKKRRRKERLCERKEEKKGEKVRTFKW